MKTFGPLSSYLKKLFLEFKPTLLFGGNEVDEDRSNWLYLEIGSESKNYLRIFDPAYPIPKSEGNVVIELKNQNMVIVFTGEVNIDVLKSSDFVDVIKRMLVSPLDLSEGRGEFAKLFASFASLVSTERVRYPAYS